MKKPVVLLVILLIVVGGGGFFYYKSLPKNAREQFDYAKQLENEFVKTKIDLSPEGIEIFKNKIVEAYQKVETFPEKEIYEEAYKGLGDFYRQQDAQDEALKIYLKFETRYPKSKLLVEIRKLIISIYRDKKEWKTLVDYLEKYVAANPDTTQTIEYLFEIAKITKSQLPKIVPMTKIKAFERVIKVEEKVHTDPWQRKFTPNCLWEISLLYESISQPASAIQFLDRLVKDYPNSEFTTKALLKKGEILAIKLDRKEEGKKELEKLKREHPESSEARKAGSEIRKIDKEIKGEKGEEAKSKQKKYLKEHYGGGSEYDISEEMIKHLGKKGLSNNALAQVLAQKLDLLHYEGQVKLQPTLNRVDATLQVTVKNLGESKNNFLLLLSPIVSLEKVMVDGVAARFDRADMRLKIILNKPLEKEKTIKVGFQFFIVNKERGKIILQESGIAMADANWYPSAFLGDIFTTNITYQIPKGWEVIGNGARLKVESKKIKEKVTEEVEENGKKVKKEVEKEIEWMFQTYEMKQPIFGIYFGYGKYKVIEEKWNEIPIYLYYKNDKFTKTKEMMDTLKDILTFYEKRFHKFQFPKMAIIEAPLPPGVGGVGPATLMFLHENTFKKDSIPESLMAHEAAHQWWGNLVPISFQKEGEAYSQWLSEGFASYSDAMYLEYKHGKTRFINHLLKYGVLYFEQCTHIEDVSISENTFHPSYVGVIYMKGACVLHALRWVMGDEKFYLALKKFAENYAFKFSSIHAFKKICDEIYGENLYWFFKQWTDSAGYPDYFIPTVEIEKVKQETEEKNLPSPPATFLHKVTVMQQRELYKMPVLLRFQGAKKEEIFDHKVWIQESKDVIEVAVPFEAQKIILDPESWIMKHPGEHNIWSKKIEEAREKSLSPSGLTAQDQIPEFSEKDIDGKWISSKNFKGKILLVNFWATWCPPCIEELPEFVSLQNKYGPKGLQIIGICMDEQKEISEIKQFCKEAKINFPVIPYLQVSFEKFGEINAIPLTYLVDQKGKIIQLVQGKRNIEFWKTAIEKLIEEK